MIYIILHNSFWVCFSQGITVPSFCIAEYEEEIGIALHCIKPLYNITQSTRAVSESVILVATWIIQMSHRYRYRIAGLEFSFCRLNMVGSSFSIRIALANVLEDGRWLIWFQFFVSCGRSSRYSNWWYRWFATIFKCYKDIICQQFFSSHSQTSKFFTWRILFFGLRST